MNKGLLIEKELVEGLFKHQNKFNRLENAILKLSLSHNINLNKDSIKIKPISNNENKKMNNTWDCVIQDGEHNVGVSIKSNNSKTTKHPQYKSLINHIYKDSVNKETHLSKFNQFELKMKQKLLLINPKANYLSDIRKDKNNNTKSEVDFFIGKEYQYFIYKMLKTEFLENDVQNFLKFSFSASPYIKITWNDNDFIIEDFLDLKELFESKILSISFNPENNNIELLFHNNLKLIIRFKISFYKKSLVGGSVKCEINIVNKPDFIKKEIIKHNN